MRSIKRWVASLAAHLRLNPKSKGVRVRRATAVHIKAGNTARDAQDWAPAALAYRRALAAEPQLQHLWVQLGHMEKESTEVERAASAYEEAARLDPDDAEPLVQLGHMTKAWGQPGDAASHFVRALQRDRSNLAALSELARLMPDRAEMDDSLWMAALAVLGIDPAGLKLDDSGHLPPGTMVFDVTDLLAFFGQRRLPTGIQRVQIEVSLACLEHAFDPQPLLCVYASDRRGWIKLPQQRFEALCRLARQSDDVADPVWISQLDVMYREIAVARTIRFSAGTVLVNLGTSWSDRNYLLDVRVVRARDAVVYVPLVFDLIPLIGPQWFMQSLVRDYRAWFGSLLHSADGCLAISQATRQDLVRTSAEWNMPVPPEAVRVVRLDGNFRQNAAAVASLRSYGLEPERYVLLVSTLEPRKNHLGAFNAWLALAETLGEAAMPRLVCVGGRGWLNQALHQLLRERPVLRRMVLILHGIPDDTLAALYEHCLFALYPSFYEGWGLPVSEALSYGKVPAISRVSSLPEAGGPFARYFDPADIADIAATVRDLLEQETRHDAETAIRQHYAPRTWERIAQDLVAQARTVTSRPQATLPSLGEAATWTLALSQYSEDSPNDADVAPGARQSMLEPTVQGEALRHGRAWQSPGLTGCRISGDDAALWFHWVGGQGGGVHLHFAATHHSTVARIAIDGSSQDWTSRPGVEMIVPCRLPDAAGPVMITILPVAGDVIIEKVVVTRGVDVRDASS